VIRTEVHYLSKQLEELIAKVFDASITSPNNNRDTLMKQKFQRGVIKQIKEQKKSRKKFENLISTLNCKPFDIYNKLGECTTELERDLEKTSSIYI